MGVTKEQVQLYVDSLYRMLLGDEDKRDLILGDLESVFKNHPKVSLTRRAQVLAILKMMRAPTITSLVNPSTLLVLMRKHWHHRKAVTSRLVPCVSTMGSQDILPRSEYDDTLVATVLKTVVQHLTPTQIENFYAILQKIIQFAEPHAVAQRWDEAKPLVTFDKWMPLEQYLASHTTTTTTTASATPKQALDRGNIATPKPPTPSEKATPNQNESDNQSDGGSEGGCIRCSGDGVQHGQGSQKGKGKRKNTGSGTHGTAPTAPRQRRRHGPTRSTTKEEEKDDDSC